MFFFEKDATLKVKGLTVKSLAFVKSVICFTEKLLI